MPCLTKSCFEQTPRNERDWLLYQKLCEIEEAQTENLETINDQLEAIQTVVDAILVIVDV
jgi:Mg2+ and Co2+ transporter CorA